MTKRKVIDSLDIELRDLINRLEEAGETKLAEELLNDYMSSEQAHREAIEDMLERESLREPEEEDFIPSPNKFDDKLIKALEVLSQKGDDNGES